MKRMLLLLLSLSGGCAHRDGNSRATATSTTPVASHETNHTHGAAPTGTRPPRLDDLGDHHRAVTATPAAQSWFDQGLRLLYAFNHDEAERAFAEGARLDGSCAACWWGVALVLGPNYNLPALPERARAAWSALAEAQARASAASPVERALITALAHRYASPPPVSAEDQGRIDGAYAEAMRQVAAQFPDDDDVQVLFAEALMDLRPWKLWLPDGTAAPDTDEIVATLEKVLARNPRHPGANHYYIHALEASPHPERALAAANRVGGMMPGAGHLVHMPSHVYQRLGKYEEAAESNRKAIAADRRYLAKTTPPGIYAMYVGHNFQFLWAAAMMAGRGNESLQAARDLVASIPPSMLQEMPGFDFVVPSPSLTLVRFGRWKEVLAEPLPPPELPLATMLSRYAQVRALTALGRLDEAQRQLAALHAAVQAIPATLMADMAPGSLLGAIAEKLARGELLLARGRHSEGLAALTDAVRDGDALPYAEPPDWYYPPRHTLGARLVGLKKWTQAEAVYREDLARNPHNGWSLVGLRRCLQAQKKPTAEVDAALAEAFKSAEAPIDASDF